MVKSSHLWRAIVGLGLVGIVFAAAIPRLPEVDVVRSRIPLPLVGHGFEGDREWWVYTGPQDAVLVAKTMDGVLRKRQWNWNGIYWSYNSQSSITAFLMRFGFIKHHPFADLAIERGRALIYPGRPVIGPWTTVRIQSSAHGSMYSSNYVPRYGGYQTYGGY